MLANFVLGIIATFNLEPLAVTDCQALNRQSGIVFTEERASPDTLGIYYLQGADRGVISFNSSELAVGPCADRIEAFSMDRVFLYGGSLLRRPPHQSPSLERSTYLTEKRLKKSEGHPKGSGTFVMGYPVAYRQAKSSLVTDYVGVWRLSDGAVVRTFSTSVGGGFTSPKDLIRSRSPIRSITFFPAPDTPSGKLFIVQQSGPSALHMVSLNWSYGGVF